MKAPADIPRKVRQLENDVESIYEMLSDIKETQQKHTAKLDEHTAKLDQHTAKLDEHTTKLDQLAVRMDDHSTKLDTIVDLLSRK